MSGWFVVDPSFITKQKKQVRNAFARLDGSGMTEPLAAALENEGHPTDVRCSWSCATCKQEGVNGVWAYAYETADETARRWTRWTLNACVRGCQFVAKAGEGREIS